MKRIFLAQVAATALAVGATSILPSLAAAQTVPPIGGGWKDVIPIPVEDPKIKAIAGSLFKPTGTGPGECGRHRLVDAMRRILARLSAQGAPSGA